MQASYSFRAAIPKALLSIILLISGFALPSLARAQETEPNNSCATASEVGAAALPMVIGGSLSVPSADVDFFRLTLTPGTRVEVELIGDFGGSSSPLSDAFLGLFVSDANGCQFQAANDDGAGFGGGRLRFNVPADGIVILAASGCCDGAFDGTHGAAGTYLLSVREFLEGAVTGRIVDERNGTPLSGEFPTDARYELAECSSAEPDSHCAAFWFDVAGPDGRFGYPTSGSGIALQVGRTYQLIARANLFEDLSTRFTVTSTTPISLGDIALPAVKLIGGIRARLLEQVTRARIPGNRPPFGIIALLSCDAEGNNCFHVTDGTTDSAGTLRFSGITQFGAPLRPGTYRIEGRSSEHTARQSGPFSVGEGEIVAVDVKLRSLFPVKISEVRPCGAPSTEGGPCTYSARVTNITRRPVEGTMWSLVEANNLGPANNHTQFQTAEPQRFKLAVGGSAVIEFQFDVPATLDDGVSLCADLFVSRGSGPLSSLYFDVVREADLFCVRKGPTGEFLLATQAEAKAIRADATARRATTQAAPFQKAR